MKPPVFNLINAVVLIVMPIGGYLLKDRPSITSLIPVLFGVLLLACHQGLKKEKKGSFRVAVVLTLLVLILLVMPLLFVFKKGDSIGVVQITSMMVTSLAALMAFTTSFMEAFKAKKNT